jgi:hypothetical protein
LVGFPGKRFNSVCFEDVEEHRGSRPGVDPTFADAAFRPFTPEQEEMFSEKSERIWDIANRVRR